MDARELSTALDNSEPPIFLKPGHNAGDLVEAHKWKVLAEEEGRVELDVHLPDHLLNPRNQLFGGFTGTYVDMVSIYVMRTLARDKAGFTWASTVNMRIDYFQPVIGPRFRLIGEVINSGRSTSLVACHFLDDEGNKLVYAITTMRSNPDQLKDQ